MVKGEQPFFRERVQELIDEERITSGLAEHELRQLTHAIELGVQSLRDQLLQIL
jgi:hypothetical protein